MGLSIGDRNDLWAAISRERLKQDAGTASRTSTAGSTTVGSAAVTAIKEESMADVCEVSEEDLLGAQGKQLGLLKKRTAAKHSDDRELYSGFAWAIAVTESRPFKGIVMCLILVNTKRK